MKRIIIILILLSLWIALFFVPKAKAESPTVKQVWNKQSIQKIIHEYAVQYKVSEVVMNKVISCESQYDLNTIGDSGKSFGLVQIHMGYWGKEVTPEMARNPYFAIEFLADKLSKKEGHLWTCYRKFYK